MADSVRVAIVGVANCASALIHGLSYYGRERAEATLPGLMSHTIGNYRVSDVEIVAAFDISASKVSQDTLLMQLPAHRMTRWNSRRFRPPGFP